MAESYFETGQASNITDFLGLIKTFLLKAHWILEEEIGLLDTDGDYIVISTPGSIKSFIQIKISDAVTKIKISGWTGWTHGISGDPGTPGSGVGTELTESWCKVQEKVGDAFKYWLFANEDRFMIVTNYAASQFDWSYAGLISTGDPVLDTYPLLITGDDPDELNDWSKAPVMYGVDGAVRRYPAMTYMVRQEAAPHSLGLFDYAQPNLRGAITKEVGLQAVVVSTYSGFTEIRGGLQGVFFVRPAIANQSLVQIGDEYYIVFNGVALGPRTG